MPIVITPSDSLGPLLGVLEDQLDDRVDLGAGLFVSAPGCHGDEHVPQDAAAADAGERDQRPVVDVRVGEGDQPLVAAAVVPQQHAGSGSSEPSASRIDSNPAVPGRSRCAGRPALPASASSSVLSETKNAVGGSCCSSPATTTCLPRRIAGDRVGGRDLAGLVEDDDVEVGPRPAAAG